MGWDGVEVLQYTTRAFATSFQAGNALALAAPNSVTILVLVTCLPDWIKALIAPSMHAQSTDIATQIMLALPSEFALAQAFYDSCGYEGAAIREDDQVVIAKSATNIVGVGRLCREHGVLVLRGMQIQAAFRRQGLGSRLLAGLVAQVGQEPCYCLPYDHLGAFYAQAGFSAVSGPQLPDFLAQRLASYLALGRKVMAMQRMP